MINISFEAGIFPNVFWKEGFSSSVLRFELPFDTIDHNILINQLEKWVDLSERALNWFRTYITGRQLGLNDLGK